MFFNPFSYKKMPTPESMIAQELAEARLEILKVESKLEHFNSWRDTLNARIKRLESK